MSTETKLEKASALFFKWYWVGLMSGVGVIFGATILSAATKLAWKVFKWTWGIE